MCGTILFPSKKKRPKVTSNSSLQEVDLSQSTRWRAMEGIASIGLRASRGIYESAVSIVLRRRAAAAAERVLEGWRRPGLK